MTDILELAKLRDLIATAQLPWRAELSDVVRDDPNDDEPWTVAHCGPGEGMEEVIVRAVNALPSLLAHITAQDARIEALEGALREPVNLCESEEAASMRFIDILRSDIAGSVTILTDNEEADTLETQRAIEVQAEWANAEWEPVRFYGETVLQALAKAVRARKAALGGEQHGG